MIEEKLPKLGFGMMRLPTVDGQIDMDETERMVDAYLDAGMNYFDTAYMYHDGASEPAVGKALTDRHPRASFFLASKLPVWLMKDAADADRIFDEQLQRCHTDYFDFYLLHSIEDGNYDRYKKYGCFEWGLGKKREGKIRHFGFSFHGSSELLERVLDDHPETEFVQIQLNYADWNSPIVESGRLYKILNERGIPIIVMEPVKGGLLAKLPPDAAEELDRERPGTTHASWALRFVGSLDGVLTILSGMSTPEQMRENTAIFDQFKPITDDDRRVLQNVVKKMEDKPIVPCTACRYCVGGCPESIRIPDIISALNTSTLYPSDPRAGFYYTSLIQAGSGKAGSCIACGQCESVCPQHLPIIELMGEAAEKFEKK